MKRYKMLIILAAMMMGFGLFGSKGYEKLKTGNGIYNTGIAGSYNSVKFVSKSNYPIDFKPFHPPWSLRRSPVITLSNGLFVLYGGLAFPILEDPTVPKTFGVKCKVTLNHKMYETGIAKWPIKVTGDEIQTALKVYSSRLENKVQKLQKKIDPLTKKLFENDKALKQLEVDSFRYENDAQPGPGHQLIRECLKEQEVYVENLRSEKEYFVEKKKDLLGKLRYTNITHGLNAAFKKGPIYTPPVDLLSLYPYPK